MSWPPPTDIPDESGAVVISIEEVRRKRYVRKGEKPQCAHARIAVDEELATVECRDCHEKLNPTAWILMAARSWREVQRMYEAHRKEARELALKRRAKCPHCNRISEIRHPTASEIRAWDEQERSRRINAGSLIIVGVEAPPEPRP